MKLKNAMFCPECEEVFCFEEITAGVKKINKADCPCCSNNNTLFLSNFILKNKGKQEEK